VDLPRTFSGASEKPLFHATFRGAADSCGMSTFLRVRLFLLSLRIAGGYEPLDVAAEAWPYGTRGIAEA
jgi:hypothetical protein